MAQNENKMKDKNWHFIEMRTNGQSYTAISKALNVSKQILIQWAKVYRHELANAKALVRDEILSTLAQRAQDRASNWYTLQDRIFTELMTRDLSSVSPEKLLQMADVTKQEINALLKDHFFEGDKELLDFKQGTERWPV